MTKVIAEVAWDPKVSLDNLSGDLALLGDLGVRPELKVFATELNRSRSIGNDDWLKAKECQYSAEATVQLMKVCLHHGRVLTPQSLEVTVTPVVLHDYIQAQNLTPPVSQAVRDGVCLAHDQLRNEVGGELVAGCELLLVSAVGWYRHAEPDDRAFYSFSPTCALS